MVFKKLLKGKKEEADVAANPEASPAAEEQVRLGRSPVSKGWAFAVAQPRSEHQRLLLLLRLPTMQTRMRAEEWCAQTMSCCAFSNSKSTRLDLVCRRRAQECCGANNAHLVPCTRLVTSRALSLQFMLHVSNLQLMCLSSTRLRRALTQWVKSMGKRLLTGSVNLINTPFPVTIFEPRSYLEKLADVWVYPRYLTAASQAQDPVERMKLVTTWFIAGKCCRNSF